LKSTDKILESEYLYGSSRLGEYAANLNLTTATVATSYFIRTRGKRRYELSNHLGNVQVVVSDRKVPIPEATNTTISYFTADIVSATDYYAFGATMPDRSFNTDGYRYGFNGKENDSEVKGTGNEQDYGARIYDPRIGRFLSVDPLKNKYAFLTPYQFASNTPIQAIDLDGKEAFFVHGTASSYERWLKDPQNPVVLNEGAQTLFDLSGNRSFEATFSWRGNIANYGNNVFNTEKDRAEAAQKLAEHVIAGMNGSEDITLIGHSHGGNVAILAIPIIAKRLRESGVTSIRINLITVSTPVDNNEGSPENPEMYADFINEHIHIYNQYDLIQTVGSNTMDFLNVSSNPFKKFKRRYKSSKTKNYEVDVSLKYTVAPNLYDPIGTLLRQASLGADAHSFDVESNLIQRDVNKGKIKGIEPKKRKSGIVSPRHF
jgi:RHS repeat-associated protein